MIRLFELASWLLARLPALLVTAAARLGGRIAFEIVGSVRRNTIANMSVVLGRPERDPAVTTLARESVAQFAEHSVDLLRFHRRTWSELRPELVSIEGWEYVLDCRKLGNGAIFASAHFGNWEIAGALVAFDYPLTVIQETFSNPEANELFRRIRAAKNITAVQLGKAAKPALLALRRNEILGLLVDRPTSDSGIEVEFFGQRTRIPSGIAKLAMRSGAPIVVGGAIRNRDRTYSVIGYPPIYPDSNLSPNADAARITQALMGRIEAMIRRRPDQWYMFREMWPGDSTCRGVAGQAIGSQA